MPELLEQYSIAEIITFLFLFATAIKAVITLWDWFVDRLRKFFNKETTTQQNRDEIKNKVQESLDRIDAVVLKQEELTTQIKTLQDTVTLLVHSDKDDIKSWITKEHHYFCYEQKYIDDYSLDCLEKRFSHYQEEGGNSFVEDLMKDLRALPKVSVLPNNPSKGK